MGLRRGASPGRAVVEDRVDAELSRLITQVTNETDLHLRERNLTRADLASRMGVSPGRVSQVLSGGENLTLRTLASLAVALDAGFEVRLEPRRAGADRGVRHQGSPGRGALAPGHGQAGRQDDFTAGGARTFPRR